MDVDLRNILRDVAKEGSIDSYTHITLVPQQVKWCVLAHNQAKFWVEYCDLVDKRINNIRDSTGTMCIAERTTNVNGYVPQTAQLIFEFHVDNNADDGWEPYDDDFLKHLCYIYQEVIAEHFKITEDTRMELIVVVLESSKAWYQKNNESGQKTMMMEVKLHFPYARIDIGLQSKIVRSKVIQLLHRENVLSKMQRQPIGDWNRIISPISTTNPSIMYGSIQDPSKPQLEVTHIWSSITEDMLEGSEETLEIALADCFIPENHSHVAQGIVDRSIFENGKPLSYWFPMFLSVGYWPTLLLPKEDLNDSNRSRMLDTPPQQRSFSNKSPYETDDIESIELCEKLISMINPRRFIIETNWLDIGKALYSSDMGGENGLFAWIAHTERALTVIGSSSLDFMLIDGSLQETCKNLYNTFCSSYITVETIAWYLREDYPERYADWHESWCIPAMEKSLSLAHADVAEAFHKVYWLEYKYCPKTGKWMHFRNHRYCEAYENLDLCVSIRKGFVKRYEAIRVVLTTQIHASNDDKFRDDAETTTKKIGKLIHSLKTDGFQRSIISQAKGYFKNDRLTSLLDSNPNLTSVTNGVIEVCGGNVIFRATKPEDYICMCTNIPYHSGYSWEHPLVRETMTWLSQIFSDTDLLHYFLKFASSCLRGRNSDKIFPIWTGDGDNSKSMLVKLFEATFGSYCIKFPVSLLTEKQSSSGNATPQLARAKCTRIGFLDEPEDDVPINKGTAKRITGGDRFFTRFLHDNGGDVDLTFIPVLMCNKVPMIPNPDRAVKNRTRLFMFNNTWTLEDPSAPPEGICIDGKMYFKEIPKEGISKNGRMYFKMDTTFERRIPFLAPPFLWICSQYFPHYFQHGLIQPNIVTETTEAYWKDNDVYAQFAADVIQEVYINTTEGKIKDSNARVTLSEIFKEFKDWFRDTFPGTKIPERPIVRAELTSRWGRMVGTAWYGIRIISNDVAVDMTTSLGGKKQPPTINKLPPITKQETIHNKQPEVTLVV